MARAKSSRLSVKKDRLSLPIAKKPVFESLGDGVCIGYRRNQSAGTWIARKADGKGGSWQKVIGTADDFTAADDGNVLSWAQAQARAFEIAKSLGKPPVEQKASKTQVTVAKALDRYEDDLKIRGGDLGNVQRLRLHVDRYLLEKAVTDLTSGDLREWRDGLLAKKLAPATINRTTNAFKAALNLTADHDDAILTRNAWEKGLASLRDAEEARNVILSDGEVKKVIEAAYKQNEEFGLLVEVAAVTGARYSQIAGLMIDDLQNDRTEPRLIMPSSKKGKGTKKVIRRPVPIPQALAKKLVQAAGDRSVDAPLLLKPQRPPTNDEKKAGATPPPPGPWCKSDHYRPFKRAVSAAFEVEDEDEVSDGDPITIYALRHSSIVRQILAGVPVRIVAVMHDTSVQMIEKNYSKHLSDHTDAIARAAMLDIGEPSSKA